MLGQTELVTLCLSLFCLFQLTLSCLPSTNKLFALNEHCLPSTSRNLPELRAVAELIHMKILTHHFALAASAIVQQPAGAAAAVADASAQFRRHMVLFKVAHGLPEGLNGLHSR